MNIWRNSFFAIVAAIFALIVPQKTARAAEVNPAPQTFSGDKTSWHGFDRYDFLMSDDFTVTPTNATPEEGSGYKHQAGGRRCIVVIPKTRASGNPWSWRGCYWDHQPQAEIELLNRGFAIAYIESGPDLRPDKSWDAWYQFLTLKHGFSVRPAFIGMSRGGEFAYTWSIRNPDKVSCIYADNPGGNWEVMNGLSGLATNDVPLLHVCGSFDPILGKFTLPIEKIYQQFGGRISVMIKEGRGHHPHSLHDPAPIADFIERSVNEKKSPPPDFVGEKFTGNSYYSSAGSYRDFPAEQTYMTLRGPAFTECYRRYYIDLKGVEAFTTVIAPNHPAAGNPWLFRADFVDRDDAIVQALLARGFYIVTGAVPYNADGPIVLQWNAIYKHLTDHGFAKKPVLSGSGGAAGEAYAWAIQNPEKVSCIYAENPLLHSNTAKVQPLDELEPLAKAGVPILHVCGADDPWLEKNTAIAEKQYAKLGGKMTVIIQKGRGHYLSADDDSESVIDFIAASTH